MKTVITTISEFEVIKPANDLETVGEKLLLSRFGEYCPKNSLRGYSLLFLLENPKFYRVSKVVMKGTEYVIAAKRPKNIGGEIFRLRKHDTE